MRICELHAKDKSISDRLYAEVGDAPRQLSLADGAALRAARDAGGLCSARFEANLHTEGLDYAALQVGDCLVAGEALLEITEKGKYCWPECALHKEDHPCMLPANTAFARVLRGGAIRTGDGIQKAPGEKTVQAHCTENF